MAGERGGKCLSALGRADEVTSPCTPAANLCGASGGDGTDGTIKGGRGEGVQGRMLPMGGKDTSRPPHLKSGPGRDDPSAALYWLAAEHFDIPSTQMKVNQKQRPSSL